MKKLYELLGTKLNKGDVGIEIEVEGTNLIKSADPRWVTTTDGSLRGEDSKEYVFKSPLPVAGVHSALASLREELDDSDAEIDFSFRTSVHVHVNCQDLTFNQYLAFIYTYLLIEEPLMTYCGRERKGNRFCLRLQDAEGVLMYVEHMFKKGYRGLREVDTERVRYAAINIAATNKFGSLEFRGMRGNLDVDFIDVWAKTLVAIKEFARKAGTPTAVYEYYSKSFPTEFFKDVVGALSQHYEYPRMGKDIESSFSLSLDLPFSFINNEVEEKKEETAKPLVGDLVVNVNNQWAVADVHPDAIIPRPRRAAQFAHVNLDQFVNQMNDQN